MLVMEVKMMVLLEKSKRKRYCFSNCLKLGTYIEENLPDVKVIYTRTKDVFVPLMKDQILQIKIKLIYLFQFI